jgi:hypothetical protein
MLMGRVARKTGRPRARIFVVFFRDGGWTWTGGGGSGGGGGHVWDEGVENKIEVYKPLGE